MLGFWVVKKTPMGNPRPFNLSGVRNGGDPIGERDFYTPSM